MEEKQMKTQIKTDKVYGKLLWISNEKIEAAASLDYGLRIMVLCHVGMQNMLYCQPDDLSDGLRTDKGWRIHGGHRFWSAPESEKSYYPDNLPVEFSICEDSVLLTQSIDEWTGLKKQLRLSFSSDDSLLVDHIMTNCNDHSVRAAAWGITTLNGGGRAIIPYGGCSGGYNPNRVISLWGDTSLGDSRLSFAEGEILVAHDPSKGKMKMGVYSQSGKITMSNLKQKLEISFITHPMEEYPDKGCNVEVYLDKSIMELETLGELKEIAPGAKAHHIESWKISSESAK